MAQSVKNLPAMQETWVHSWGQEDPMEEDMARRERGQIEVFLKKLKKRCILCVFGGRWMSSSDLHFKKHPFARTME